MTRLGLALRFAVQGGSFLLAAPVLWLAARGGLPLAGTIPVAFHRLFLRLFGVRVRVLGTAPNGRTPTLVLANHVSWLDIPVLSSLTPLSFVAKSEIADWPLFGRCARLQRCIFLDRSRKAATAEANDLIAGRLAAGDVIVLFAEGTTGDGWRLLPFRSSLVGAARAALLGSGLDTITLQPLALAYTRRNGLPMSRRAMPEIAWYGDMELGPHLAGFVRGGPIDAVAAWGEPIAFSLSSDRKKATALAEAAVRDAIRAVRRGTA